MYFTAWPFSKLQVLHWPVARAALKVPTNPHKAYLEDGMDALTIVFDDWEQVLASTLPPDLRKPYREAIVKFRYWLRQTGKTPDAETFKEHLDTR